MEVTLHLTSGPSSGKTMRVSTGQVANVGKAGGAEHAVSGDSTMSDLHFSLTCDSRNCHLRDLDSAAGTLVNGKRVARAILKEGDRITAGQTTFRVALPGVAESEDVAQGAPVAAATAAAGPAATATARQEDGGSDTAAEACKQLEMSDEALALLPEDCSREEYLRTLVEHELFPDAIRFLAYWIPRPKAVDWARSCVASVGAGDMPDVENRALEVAELWSREPTEEHRRAAETAAAATGLKGAAGWVALAAFWSGGSLAPPDLPEVPPGPALTAQAVTAALMLAAVQRPEEAEARYRAFLDEGQKLKV